MFPILFKIGPLTFHTYGLLIALGVFFGLKMTVALARRDGFGSSETEESLGRLILYFLAGGILGGRLFHVAVYWRDYVADPVAILKIWEGGLVSYGGFLGAVTAFLIWHRGLSKEAWAAKAAPGGGLWRRVADWLSPSLAFGHALGRLGCFAAGCCYGVPTDRFWGVVFTDPDSLAPLGVPLHPTQIYEAAFLLALGGFLLWRFRRRSVPGGVFADYLLLYPLARFFLEFLRANEPTFLSLTAGQIMSMLVFAAGLFLRQYLTKKSTITIL